MGIDCHNEVVDIFEPVWEGEVAESRFVPGPGLGLQTSTGGTRIVDWKAAVAIIEIVRLLEPHSSQQLFSVVQFEKDSYQGMASAMPTTAE
jgi:hypothetical protein